MSLLGNTVRALRGDLSQVDFAKKVGLSHRLITKIEAGEKPKRANVLRIAERMRVPKDERLDLLRLWLRQELGDADFKLVTAQPGTEPEPALPLTKRLQRAVARLAPHFQEQLLLACSRPAVLHSIAPLNTLHDKVKSGA